MKIKNIKDVDGFFKVIDSCAGKSVDNPHRAYFTGWEDKKI